MSARAARSAGRILVGTTSWTENTLLERKRFYPAAVQSPEERLQYYASVFPIVEVDSTFYALSSTSTARPWLERTEPSFVFDVKAFRLFTLHRTPLRSLPADMRASVETDDGNVHYDKLPRTLRQEIWLRFRAELEPLRTSGRLGVVLFELAPAMLFDERAHKHIAHCAEQMSGFEIAVELRNRSWLSAEHREQTSRFLRDQHITQVVVDEPQGTSSSMPSVWAATTDVAVVRLYGRKRQNPKRRGSYSPAERSAYRYTDEELRKFVAPVKELARQTREVHVLFNNSHSDWAQRNASRFTEMLAKSPVATDAARSVAGTRSATGSER